MLPDLKIRGKSAVTLHWAASAKTRASSPGLLLGWARAVAGHHDPAAPPGQRLTLQAEASLRLDICPGPARALAACCYCYSDISAGSVCTDTDAEPEAWSRHWQLSLSLGSTRVLARVALWQQLSILRAK